MTFLGLAGEEPWFAAGLAGEEPPFVASGGEYRALNEVVLLLPGDVFAGRPMMHPTVDPHVGF